MIFSENITNFIIEKLQEVNAIIPSENVINYIAEKWWVFSVKKLRDAQKYYQSGQFRPHIRCKVCIANFPPHHRYPNGLQPLRLGRQRHCICTCVYFYSFRVSSLNAIKSMRERERERHTGRESDSRRRWRERRSAEMKRATIFWDSRDGDAERTECGVNEASVGSAISKP